jgi:NTE family protein
VATALVFNSCFFGFFAHLGFLRELERAGIEAGAASGSSAGALAAAAVASGLPAERALEMALALRREDFWDPDPLLPAALRLGRVRGARFEDLLRRHLPRERIEDCRIPLVISAVSLPFLAPRLLARGPLATAIHASCAVPFLLQPVRFGNELLWDGGVRIEAPLQAVLQRSEVKRAIVHVAGWRANGISPSLRREILQARRSGVEVHVARTLYPAVDPDHLDRAPAAVAAGAESARRLLG